jgi:hypothetical protein
MLAILAIPAILAISSLSLSCNTTVKVLWFHDLDGKTGEWSCPGGENPGQGGDPSALEPGNQNRKRGSMMTDKGLGQQDGHAKGVRVGKIG